MLKKYKNLAVLSITIALILGYFGGVLFYRQRFLPGTNVGNWSLEGKSLASAQSMFQKTFEEYELEFQEDDQSLGYITLNQIDLKVTNPTILEETLNQQNAFSWPIHIFRSENIEPTELFQAEDDALAGLIDAIIPDNNDREASRNAHYEDVDGQFQVVKETYGTKVTPQSLEKGILDRFASKEHQLDLKDVYSQPTLLSDDSRLEEVQDEIIELQQHPVTIAFDGLEIDIPQEFIEAWITVDEDGVPKADQALIQSYIQELNVHYSSLLNPHLFHSYYHGDIYVQPGTFGWYLDIEIVSEELSNFIGQRSTGLFEPTISGSGYGLVGNPLDYVEVDLTSQMMLVFRDGALLIDTPIVSGYHLTPTDPGVYEVWQMLADTNLVGYDPIAESDYSIPVQYWIALDYDGLGIHDASWQGAFGGNVHVNAGSLGCINTPPNVMGEVFSNIYIGMPVYIH